MRLQQCCVRAPSLSNFPCTGVHCTALHTALCTLKHQLPMHRCAAVDQGLRQEALVSGTTSRPSLAPHAHYDAHHFAPCAVHYFVPSFFTILYNFAQLFCTRRAETKGPGHSHQHAPYAHICTYAPYMHHICPYMQICTIYAPYAHYHFALVCTTLL